MRVKSLTAQDILTARLTAAIQKCLPSKISNGSIQDQAESLIRFEGGKPEQEEEQQREYDAIEVKLRANWCKMRLATFITINRQMGIMKEIASDLAPAGSPILIYGPSGVGKQIIAESLHDSRTGKFVDVNCAAIPESLADSLLFGHVKGAFTGADRDHKGLFVEAQGGTLFLDEIHALPKMIQFKILKAIEYGIYTPVGGVPTDVRHRQKVSVRVVAATNRKLEDNPEFLEDLYARLSVFELTISPLLEREEDIPLILESFGCKYACPQWLKPRVAKYNVRALKAFAEQCSMFGEIKQPGEYL